jgi:hypothetical protein
MRPSMLLPLLLLAAGCAPKRILLQAPNAGTGSLYTCVVGTQDNCKPATVDIPSQQNRADTTYINLPPECNGRVRAILVQDIQGGKPTLLVKCSPPENPIAPPP